MKQVGIFVPARLNSERLPNKQILPIGELSMFEIACKKLKSLSVDYEVAVLIKDKELMDIAAKYEIPIIIRSNLSCAIDGPWNKIFKELSNMKSEYLMFLNPSVIFLKESTIRNAIEKFKNSQYESATSVKPFTNWLYDEYGEMIVLPDMTNLSTKHIKGIMQPAHCFHILNKEKMLNENIVLEKSHLLIPVDSNETIDIDTTDDYMYARWKYETSI